VPDSVPPDAKALPGAQSSHERDAWDVVAAALATPAPERAGALADACERRPELLRDVLGLVLALADSVPERSWHGAVGHWLGELGAEPAPVEDSGSSPDRDGPTRP
jgi:hypothetical protein